MKKLIRLFVSKEFLMYGLAGCINTFNASLFSFLLADVAHCNDNVAATAGYILSLILAYFISSKIVFHKPYAFKRFVEFVLTYIPNFLIYTGVCFITINWLHLHQFIATALPIMVASPITFVLLKCVAFGEKKHEE